MNCDTAQAKPELSFVFFTLYIILSAWVIMTLFIGVISTGMFDAFEALKREKSHLLYMKKLVRPSGERSPHLFYMKKLVMKQDPPPPRKCWYLFLCLWPLWYPPPSLSLSLN